MADDDRELEDRLGIPPGFGGLVGFWLPAERRALVVRCGRGRVVELMQLTPLNAVQLEKLAHGLVEEGKRQRKITDEHLTQADKLPMAPPQEYDAEYVNRITGDE